MRTPRLSRLFASKRHVDRLPRVYIGTPPDVVDFRKIPTASAPPLRTGMAITLSDAQVHHVTTVLRLDRRKQSQIRLFDGINGEWLGQLVWSGKRSAIVELSERLSSSSSSSSSSVEGPSSDSKCWLWSAPPKKRDRLRWLVEKTTELGVDGIMWLNTDYCEGSIQLAKIQSYIIDAAEQSERLSLPYLLGMEDDGDSRISPQVDLERLLELYKENSEDFPQLLTCTERSLDATPVLATSMGQQVAFLVGPEGGWSPAEKELLVQFTQGVSLGPTVLRAETAAVTAVAAHTLLQHGSK